MATNHTVPVARDRGLFGSDGGMLLALYPAFPHDFAAGEPLFAEIDALPVALFCNTFERRGVTGAFVRFDDIDTERRASEFMGLELSLRTEQPAADEEFRMEELIGFEAEATVAGQRHRYRGVVTDFYDNEANPLFELEIDGRPVLVPAAEEFFARIDFDARRVKLVLPDGLLTLH